MDVFGRITETLYGKSKWMDILGRTPGLKSVGDLLKIIWSYHPDNPDMTGYDDYKQMDQDMRDIATMRVWVGTLLGRLQGLSKNAKTELSNIEIETKIKERDRGASIEQAKDLGKITAREFGKAHVELQDVIELVEQVYGASQKFVEVLKHRVTHAREDDGRYAAGE